MLRFRLIALSWCALVLSGLVGLAAAPADPASASGPSMVQIVPAPGETLSEFLTVEVQFDQPVTGVNASDLLINGQPATDVSEVVQGQFVFTVPAEANGAIHLQWVSNHGIADESGAPFAGGAWSYTLNTNLPPQVIISEFMASNKRTLRDSDGDSSDWIELFNPSEDEVSLDGWYLTGSSANLQQWQFPAVSIPGRGFLVVFASEKDRRVPGSELHTNFRLSEKGQFLALVSPAGDVASAFAPGYPAQTIDVSYGRAQGAPESVGFFSKPTPGTVNATTGVGFAPAVEFSAVTGLYSNAFSLTLRSATNAVIRYTLNGTLPSISSPAYTQPIPIATTALVRARAFQDRLLPGPVRTENFAFFSNLQNFTSTLPVIVIQTLWRAPVSTTQTTSEFSIFPPRNGVTTLTNTAALTLRGGIHLRGSSTLGLPKSAYAVEFWDEFNNSVDVSLLGLPADSDWVLYAPDQYEPIMIHNPFIYQLSREIGQYSSRTRFVELFVQSKTGVINYTAYRGIYVLEEKIKIGKDRVDIDKLRPQNVTQPTVTGGYLLKVDRTGPGESGIPAAGTTVVYVDPKEKDVRQPARAPQATYIRNYFTNFGKALNAANWRDPVSGYRAFIDEQSWIDYHVLEVLSGNVDTLVLSCYFHKPREGKLTFGPHWDFDRALGSTDGRDSNPRNWNTGSFFSAPWWNKMFADKDFWQHWVDRWQDLRASTFAMDHLGHLIDTLSGELREAQPRETDKWHVGLRGGNGYQGEIDLMKNWLSNRIDFIDKQLTQPVVPSIPPGSVSAGTLLRLSAESPATIYYTLDGSDPRLTQGNLSPTALVYSGPILIDRNVRLFARARDLAKKQSGGPPTASSTPWSSPTVGAYFTAVPQLLVTEINFHPVAPLGATNPPSEYEFIEIKNAGAEPVELAGMVLSGGVSFTFAARGPVARLPSGERLLLVKNQAAFQQAYPALANIAGQYAGSLANGGDRLVLRGPLGERIFDFTFKDSWQRVADGLGFTLTLADEGISPAALGDESNWRASAAVGGSPGLPDARPVPGPAVQVTEIISNALDSGPDEIELYNPSNSEVNLSGWGLTDDPAAPFKYVIPDGVYIPGRGFLVLTSSQFNDGGAGFGLSAAGDSVYLFAADRNGNLTGYYHGFNFGAADPGSSFGLFVTSDGRQRFVRQQESSFGFPNGYPDVGPLVISEIMYSPNSENALQEFVELENITDAPVRLADAANPVNTWRLRGGISYDFSPDVVMGPRESIVITPINPASQFFANQFRSRYGIPTNVRLFGPWSGTLANEGGSVTLERPVSGESNYTLLDAVHYSPRAPWPDVFGGNLGRSISRIGLSFFGDDPANWTATLPTPGQLDSDGDGLPDWWELRNDLDPHSAADDNGTLGDPDGDGFSNYEEFLAGTSPVDANSFLALRQTLTGRLVTLTFSPLIGRSYTVYYADDVSANVWHPLRNFSLVSSTSPIAVYEQASRRARYYKLQVP